MRNALRLVLDRNTNQLIVAPQTPLPALGEGRGVGASTNAVPDLDTINDRCAAVRLNTFAGAVQRNIPRRSAWEAADASAAALRQQLLRPEPVEGQVPA